MSTLSDTRWRRWIPNAALFLWLAGDGARILANSSFDPSGIINALLGITLLLTGVYVLIRPSPRASEINWPSSVFVVVTAFVPWIWWWIPGLGGPVRAPELAIRAVAVTATLASILTLRTNFSVLPQIRQLCSQGPYSVVRHPLYLAYLIFDLSFFVDRPNIPAIILWTIEGWSLMVRAALEERLLIVGLSGYACYCQRVRWRFFPGLV